MRFIGTCVAMVMLLSAQAWAVNDPKMHRPTTQTHRAENSHPPRNKANCDLAAHETDGTTTCLEEPQVRAHKNGDVVGDRTAPTGLPGLPIGQGSY
jgi:hypothetical protein